MALVLISVFSKVSHKSLMELSIDSFGFSAFFISFDIGVSGGVTSGDFEPCSSICCSSGSSLLFTDFDLTCSIILFLLMKLFMMLSLPMPLSLYWRSSFSLSSCCSLIVFSFIEVCFDTFTASTRTSSGMVGTDLNDPLVNFSRLV